MKLFIAEFQWLLKTSASDLKLKLRGSENRRKKLCLCLLKASVDLPLWMKLERLGTSVATRMLRSESSRARLTDGTY